MKEEAQEYRKQLEGHLRAHIPDVVWRRLVRGNFVNAVHTGGDKNSWRELEDEAREELEVWRDGRDGLSGSRAPGRGEERGAPQEIEIELDDYTDKRGEVFSELAATLAALRPDVQSFRWRYLRGCLLTEKEADAFLKMRDTGPRTLDIRHISAQRQLNRLAARMARLYGWCERDAALFLLTGREPEYRPVRVMVRFTESTYEYVPNTARVTVMAEVWADKEEVAEAFGTAQRQILGHDNRKKPDKVLEAVRFVAHQIREHGSRPSWEKLAGLWNRTHPGQRYNSRQGLRQAFERFTHPDYNPPKWKYRDTSLTLTGTNNGEQER